MDSEERMSMTPPSSPIIGSMLIDDDWSMDKADVVQEVNEVDLISTVDEPAVGTETLCNIFSCNKNSILESGEFSRLLETPNHESRNTELKVEFSDFQLTLNDLSSLDLVFNKLKQEIDKLERNSVFSFTDQTDLTKIRKNIRLLFKDLSCLISWTSTQDKEQSACLLSHLLLHIKGLLLFIGNLIDLPAHVLAEVTDHSNTQSSSLSQRIFHLHLDLHWSIVEFIHNVQLIYPDYHCDLQLCTTTNSYVTTDIFSQTMQLLLWDFTVMAINKYNKLSTHDASSTSFWSCSCVKELVIMIIQLLQHRQQTMAKQSFWVMYNPILQAVLDSSHETPELDDVEMDSDIVMLPPAFRCSDATGFCWWVLPQLAKLFQHDQFGVETTNKVNSNNYMMIETMLKSLLQQNTKPKERLMRSNIRCCIELCDIWGANMEMMVILWEHFYRRMNEHFAIQSTGIMGFATSDDETSMKLFLKLLDVNLSKMNAIEVNKFKGRVFSKFHQRRMQELTEAGLLHFNELFTTLAKHGNVENIALKQLDLYKFIQTSYLDRRRRTAMWQGLFSFLLLFQREGLNCSVLANHLAEDFIKVVSQLNQPGIDSSARHNLWNLVQLYMERTRELFEDSSSLDLDQSLLLSPGFRDLLNKCRQSELAEVFDFVQAIATKLRLVYKKNKTSIKHKELANLMWEYFYGFVKTHSCSQTPIPSLADLAATFTLMTYDMPNSPESLNSIFMYFAFEESVNVKITSRYLCHFLANSELMDRLTLTLTDPQLQLVSVWFRCVWMSTAESDQLDELTRLILKLPVLSPFNLEADSYMTVAVQFIKNLGKIFSELHDFKGRIEFQGQVKVMLGDVTKNINLALKNLNVEKLIKNTYMLGGQLVKNCGNLLYVRSNPNCVLPVLLDRLILPRSVTTGTKQAPPIIITAIRQHLHLFVQGLAKLDYKRDSYLNRRLGDIVKQYLPRFPIRSTSLGNAASAVHPLLVSLSHSCSRKLSVAAEEFREIVLQFVFSSPDAQAFSFSQELLSRTHSPEQIVRDIPTVLPPTLTCLLTQEHKSHSTAILQYLLEAAAKLHPSPLQEHKVIFKKFIKTKGKLYDVQIFKVLEMVAVTYPALVTSLVPDMTQLVKEIEMKRGAGVDKQIRIHYFGVLQHCGSVGQEEKSKLLKDSTI